MANRALTKTYPRRKLQNLNTYMIRSYRGWLEYVVLTAEEYYWTDSGDGREQ